MLPSAILPIRLPFLKSQDTVVFVSSGPKAEKVFAKRLRKINRMFARRGVKLLFLPDFLKNVASVSKGYLMPYDTPLGEMTETIGKQTIDSVQTRLSEPAVMGFVRQDGGDHFFTPINPAEMLLEVTEYLESLALEDSAKDPFWSTIRVDHAVFEDDFLEEDTTVRPYMKICPPMADADRVIVRRCQDFDEMELPTIEPPSPPAREYEILDALRKLAAQYGMGIEDIENLLASQVKLSRLRITKSGNIVLPDMGDKTLDLDTLSRAIYILFLMHPEGIGYKSLCDYSDELLRIYSRISNKGSMDDIRAVVEHITSPFNSQQISIHASRIKSAFNSALPEKVARFYYIQGPQGQPKKIALNRSYVIWD